MNVLELEDKIEKELKNTNEILNDVLGMVKNHEAYISDGKKWRVTVIGLTVTMLMQVGGGLYLAGQITEKLTNVAKLSERNEQRLDRYDQEIRQLIREGRDYLRNKTN